ncbi:MAG: phosphotransferase [Bryobacter sp.]|nr:phosphotransferase [Bryobacter sp.]
MLTLDPATAAELVAAHLGWPKVGLVAEELAGGVSNIVIRVAEPGGESVVLKQSLARLRVAEEWLCERERIYDEADALRTLAAVAPAASLPRVLFEDRENYLFAMTAAAAGAPTWKEQLLAGEVHLDLARQAAQLAAAFWQAPSARARFASRDRFEQLRVAPYYRHTLTRHADLAGPFSRAIDAALGKAQALVHGDWSPKNFLVNPGPRLFSIDYEVMHWGDPGFDTAFLLNHFVLKGWHRAGAQPLYAALGREYLQHLIALTGATDLEAATLVHLPCLHLARVDGKSPAEYLSPAAQGHVRRFARDLLQNPVQSVAEVFERQAEAFHE